MTEQIFQYRMIRKLGAGGMGDVYLAEDTRLNRQVALKLLSPRLATQENSRKRFVREARAASALNHSNVCIIYEVNESEDGRPFIAMEFIEGKSLVDVMREGPMPIAKVIDIAVQVTDALESAHAKGIVHRDIKPANITITARGQVKVLDFGLAKRMDDPEIPEGEHTSALATTPGTVLGTPAYMSPEQTRGQELDNRSDIFSFGVVLYEMVAGRRPFPGSTFAEVAGKIVNGRFEPMARFNYDVPPELDRIGRKCLAAEPERRFQSAHELRVDLENLRRVVQSAADSSALMPASPAEAGSGFGQGGGVTLTATYDRLEPAATVTSSPPAESDVLLAYASLDDQPLTGGRTGWVSQFHANLALRIAQLSGREVQVWKQPGSASTSTGAADRVPDAKACISVVSPPFVRSIGCRRTVENFCRIAENLGGVETDQHSRILKVVKTPVEDMEIPPEIRPVFSRLVPYEFFERDPQSGRVREFDEAFGDLSRQRFHERVYDVAFEVAQVLKNVASIVQSPKPGAAAGKKVFLAATTSDLEPQRDQLRRELLEQGHEVLPRQPLPLVAADIMTIVRSCLEECDLAIHLIGEHYGLVPEGTEHSVVALQNQVAAEQGRVKRLIWMPKGVAPRDARQAAFLQLIERDPAAHRGAEVIVDTMENLKVLLRSRWERQKPAAVTTTSRAGEKAPPRVYLICDRQDEAVIEPLQDVLFDRGIEVSLPGFDAGESEVQEIHIQNLRDCDAALIYYGAAGMHWVDFNIRDLQKAAGYRDAVPIGIQTVYVAPPFNHRKERFRSVTAQVITQPGAKFDPSALEAFVNSVKELKEKQG